jgi:uncharacterized membrane protein YfcA
MFAVRPPAFLGGAAVAVFGGLIGVGGAELRLPLLMLIFKLYPHRAVRINLLISFATLGVSALSRFGFAAAPNLDGLMPVIVAMGAGGVTAAWVGVGVVARIPKDLVQTIIAIALLAIALLLAVELYAVNVPGLLPQDFGTRVGVAFLAGLAVGSISSLLGVAGGELIIPILMFLFGADIKTAGTASVLIGLPIVFTGIIRHWRLGRYRSPSLFANLVLPMSAGSIAGAVLGGAFAAFAPNEALKLILAAILAVSALKLLKHDH